jgi:hypothetical protein
MHGVQGEVVGPRLEQPGEQGAVGRLDGRAALAHPVRRDQHCVIGEVFEHLVGTAGGKCRELMIQDCSRIHCFSPQHDAGP